MIKKINTLYLYMDFIVRLGKNQVNKDNGKYSGNEEEVSSYIILSVK